MTSRFPLPASPSAPGAAPEELARHARTLLDALSREVSAAVLVVEVGSLAVLEHNAAAAALWPPGVLGLGRAVPELPGAEGLRRALEHGEESRTTLQRPGSSQWLRQSCVPLRRADGQLGAVLWLLEDVSAAQEARAQQRRLEEFREQFLKLVSHDLRTPLGAISLGVGSLLRAGGLNERQEKILNRTGHSAQRLERMIRDAVDWARVSLGMDLPLHNGPTPVRELVQKAVATARAEHPGRELRVDLAVDGQGDWDPQKVEHILGILLDNALAYSPESSGVDLVVSRAGNHAVFAVRNDGELLPEVRAVLFAPFRRLDMVRARPRALGLGLHVTTLVARAHGGSIDVDSGAAGTTLTLRLPLMVS